MRHKDWISVVDLVTKNPSVKKCPNGFIVSGRSITLRAGTLYYDGVKSDLSEIIQNLKNLSYNTFCSKTLEEVIDTLCLI